MVLLRSFFYVVLLYAIILFCPVHYHTTLYTAVLYCSLQRSTVFCGSEYEMKMPSTEVTKKVVSYSCVS